MRVMIFVTCLWLGCSRLALGDDATAPVTDGGLIGSWVRTDRQQDGTALKLLKIFTPTHFCVFQQGESDPRPELFQSHAGTYEVAGNVLIERYDFSSLAAMRGKAARSSVQVKGKILEQKWVLPDGTSLTEEWRREEPPQ